ncbi:juvenile hormone acid O-methyltransferase [Eurytemora carolleeae]|uniref:juvenile hormone acid O-methyltransferase n=1 Tax=Eurytemora carolleeae TaxID=1294199 RepID=UPI000C7703F0|nr:juvenile hormone acid O-methyltransferase [Eurytemora carolleeae]|eukprot:XP_023342020.1 juvenile hormone acid O-methyltransferase-like [Eurytemora affinis]
MQDAALYSSSNQMQRRDAEIALSTILPTMSWNDNERILDIGSGSGDVTVTLISQRIPVLHKMTGIDNSLEMVRFSSLNYGDKNTEFHYMDLEKMEESPRLMFPEGFTKVFSLYCFHWVSDLEKMMLNVYELLVDGGEAMLLFLASNPIFRMYEILGKNIRWSKYMQDVGDFMPVYQDVTNPEEIFRKVLKKSGFQIQTCQVEKRSFTFADENQLVSSIRAVNPFLKRIPQGEQAEFLKDCMRTLESIGTPICQGRAEARYKLILAHIRKPMRGKN